MTSPSEMADPVPIEAGSRAIAPEEPVPEVAVARRRFRMPGGRTGAGTALILLAFIVFPSAFLGYLSWRAIENERSFSLERLRESYRQLTGLAARQIDRQLRDLETRWITEIDYVLLASPSTVPTAAQLNERTGKEPLVSGYFLLSLPGKTVYPPIPLSNEGPNAAAWEQEAHVREHTLFTSLVARGEELEYREEDYAAAIAAYRDILGQVSNPQLRAMAESYVGRVQIKNEDATEALATFRGLLERYPEARDLNRMYLRFLAQYQIALVLQGLGRNREALDGLVELNEDLLRRSDAINTTQYTYYTDLIRDLVPQLLEGPPLIQRERYAQVFRILGERNKKHISDKYFLQLLDAELNETVIRRKQFSPRIHYMSASAEGEPFLLAYRALPDAQGVHTTGILAVQIDLEVLQRELLPAIESLHSGSDVAVAVLGAGGEEVIGTNVSSRAPLAAQNLASPFDFWQVAVSLRDVPSAMKQLDFRTTLWLWLIGVLLLSILFGAYLFILRARREALLSRAQTTFVANVTHELRTPLASIKMFVELLEMQMPRATNPSEAKYRKDAERYLAIIGQESDRLGRLIDRVIDFSKTERRAQHYHFEAHDIGAVVSGILESFRPHAAAQEFTLGLSVEDALPRLNIDADAISQVLLNLLSNAVHYSGDVKEIQVRVRQEGLAVVIDVSDRGLGIHPKEIHKVFDKFYSGRRRMDARTQSGLGLGLTLSREIVRAHGGDIQVTSVVGEGSTFSVVLPLTESAAEAPARGPDPVDTDAPLGQIP